MKRYIDILISIAIISMLFSGCASAGKSESEGPDGGSVYAGTAETEKPGEAPPIGETKMLPEFSAPEARVKSEAADDSFISRSDARESDFGAFADITEYEEASPSPSVSRPSAQSESGLKAGYSDDNRQYGFYIDFLQKYAEQVVPLELNVSERIMLTVNDKDGRSIPGASVSLSSGGMKLTGLTHADGCYQINPSAFPGEDPISVIISPGSTNSSEPIRIMADRNGSRSISVKTDRARTLPDPIPVDIVFVMDTTGSMGEEIERLKNTIQIINLNLSSLSIPAEIRFGMVLYKDIGDEYRTSLIPLTGDMDSFQAQLDQVYADGGGDTPEDLEAAMGELINNMNWNSRALKLSYIITDAPAHFDYQSAYRLEDAARDARATGIKVYGIGTGGLDLQGEYTLRQIAQYTSARYIFLTYGSETGESSGGAPGSVSHHTGTNWNADKLESIVIRFAKEELSYLSNTPLADEDPWFEAGKIETETAEETLASLFNQAIQQLLDYSTFPVTKSSPVAVLNFQSDERFAADAEYFNEHFILSADRNEQLLLAERKDLGQLAAELELQYSGLTDEAEIGRLGEFLNAEIIITGRIFVKDSNYELFLKMLRTETGEVLSVTRAVISAELGLE